MKKVWNGSSPPAMTRMTTSSWTAGFVILAVCCLICSAQGQNYIFTGPDVAPPPPPPQFIPTSYHQQNHQHQAHHFIDPQEITPFRQAPPTGFHQVDSYLPQRDLQTSDLPFHLQQTLPQYRITTKQPPQLQYNTIHQQQTQQQYSFPSSVPAPFSRPNGNSFEQNFIVPSTHRPNYSHLFSHGHNRNPSQTETFLGEITLQSPADLPPPQPFNDFRPSAFSLRPEAQISESVISENVKSAPKGVNAVKLSAGSRGGNFLNHRTRIFAPDSTKTKGKTQVKNYFVNNNGEVFITTKTPFVPKSAQSSTLAPAVTTIAQGQNLPNKNTQPRSSFDIESLLEDPVKNDKNSSQNADDLVEVIRSVQHEVNSTEETASEEKDDTTAYYPDYDVTESSGIQSVEYPDSKEKNLEHPDSRRPEYPDPKPEEDNDNQDEPNDEEDYEIDAVTDINTSGEVYTTVQPTQTARLEPNSTKHQEVDGIEATKETGVSKEISLPDPDVLTKSIETATMESLSLEKESDDSIPAKNQVVSVVTTKSVVNNTVIGSVTMSPPVTQQVSSSTEKYINVDNTTDMWVIVASVQTSRSVSGTRYLPSPDVMQEENVQSLSKELESSPSFDQTDDNKSKDENVNKTEAEPAKDVVDQTDEEVSTNKPKTSTESLIDKLDRVQSDLSSALLTGGFKDDGNNIAVITDTMLDVGLTSTTVTTERTTKSPLPPVIIRKFSPYARPSSTQRPRNNKIFESAKPDDLSSLLPLGFKPKYQNTRKSASTVTSTTTTESTLFDVNMAQGDEPPRNEINKNSTSARASGISSKTQVTIQDVSSFLPPGFKADKKPDDSNKLLSEILSKLKPQQKNVNESQTKPKPDKFNKTLQKTKQDDATHLLPPGYNSPEPDDKASKVLKNTKEDDVSAFLPPGYKSFKTSSPRTTTSSTTEATKAKKTGLVDDLLSKAKPVSNISSLLPPGYNPHTKPTKKGVEGLLSEAKPVDISSFLPSGYKPMGRTTQKPTTKNVVEKTNVPTSLLPPGYRLRYSDLNRENSNFSMTTTSISSTTSSTIISSTTPKSSGGGGLKIVFPSRPGGGSRKVSANRLTTPKVLSGEEARATAPTIQKGWPSRATTEFTGWPTPSTTPISIEKLLEAARKASTSTEPNGKDEEVTTTSTTTTTTTTTTPKPTTPGVCVKECDLAGTIRLVGGAKWVPELLDRNTKEWQILANEVEIQLEEVFSKSDTFNKWYKSIRIDGFSEGSILVDYLVELNDLGRQIDTAEIKKIFHESLDKSSDTATGNSNTNREGKALNESASQQVDGEGENGGEKLVLGKFVLDPKYTDFIVLPKHAYPTVGYAEDNVLLPQWAIAVIVIGLASLLFVIIFGVTVLVNRQKNAKKKAPIPLTEDMLSELNKNHMGGIDNIGADDLYNMEDVWNEREYDPKFSKKRSSGSIQENSMSNLYDSWRSEWNGYYYNNYYGNNPGSHTSHTSRRRSDYDTNF